MSYASDDAEGDYAEALAEAPIRWCGCCFAFRPELEGRCTRCGNAHMRGDDVSPRLSSHSTTGDTDGND